MASLHLSQFPEELLERILSFCAVADPVQPVRPAWHRTVRRVAPAGPSTQQQQQPPQAPRTRLALLLVSKAFLRICTPLFYDTLTLASAAQLHALLAMALHPSPFLAGHVRRVVLAGVWGEAGELLRMCRGTLKMLDVTLDVPQLPLGVAPGAVRDFDAEEFCEALGELRVLRHVVIRKPHHVYLTHPKPRYVLAEVAKAMESWDNLEHADVAFRLSDDSGSKSTLAIPPQPGPMSVLTRSLSTRPKLHTFSTILPSIWNEAILRVSANPSLERIILADCSNSGAQPPRAGGDQVYHHGIAPTSLFMLGVKNHARLGELIRAGTCIVRIRAQTMGSPVVPAVMVGGQMTASCGPRRSMLGYQTPMSGGSAASASRANAAASVAASAGSSSDVSSRPSSSTTACELGLATSSLSATGAPLCK